MHEGAFFSFNTEKQEKTKQRQLTLLLLSLRHYASLSQIGSVATDPECRATIHQRLEVIYGLWVLAILSLYIEENYREGVDGNLGDDHTFSII